MRRKYLPGEKREIIIEFIRKNPKTTYREIKKKTCLNVNKEFKNGLKEAFKESNIKFPRTFERKTRDEKKKIIIDYIKKNQNVGMQVIAKETKINPSNVFRSIKDAYKLAEVKYPRRIDERTREEKS